MPEPNRPPLSPAAQSVLDAYKEASDGRYIDGEWVQDHAGQVAAALWAASESIEHSWDGAECVDHLQALAAELNGTDYGEAEGAPPVA